MIEYQVPHRDGDGKGEVIALVTTITEMTAAPAPLLAQACPQRWEHETGNAQLKTWLRGDHGTRHHGPATIKLVNLCQLTLAA